MTPLFRRRLGVLVGIALIWALGAPSPATAVTIDEKRSEAARLQTEMDEKGRLVSIAAEQFNRAQARLEGIEASKADAQAALAQADRRMTEANNRVAAAAVAAYVGGGAPALLSRLAGATSGDDLVVRRQYLRVTSTDHQEVVGQMRAAKEDLGLLQDRLATQEAEAREATAAAADRSSEARAAEAALRSVLGRVQGELGELVAAEAARRAEADTRAANEARAAAAAAEAARRAAQPTPGPSAVPAEAAPAQLAAEAAPSDAGATAVAEARRQIGKPYRWGGSGPDSFDCSGLTAWAWRAAGVTLPHSAYLQYTQTARVAQADIRPGDLLFFGPNVSGIHHNAIYIGDGQMIEASQTGTPIRYRAWRSVDLVGIGRPG